MLAAGAPISSAQSKGFREVELKPDELILGSAFEDLDGDERIDPVVAVGHRVGREAVARQLVIHRLKSATEGGPPTYVEAFRLDVPDDVVAFGVGDLLGQGQSQIVYFTARSAFAIDPAVGQPQRVLGSQRFFFAASARDSLPFWDGIEDLDGDDRADLVVPLPRGYGVWRWSGSGLERVGTLEVERDYATFADRAWEVVRTDLVSRRSVNRLGVADADGDGRRDLLSIEKKDIVAFHQSPEGRFPAEPSSRRRVISPRGMPFERFMGGAGRAPPPNVVFGDINADGRVDIVVPELDFRALSTRLRIFMGGEDGLPEAPSQIIKLSSMGDLPELVDINGDGRLDLGCSTMRTDLLMALTRPSVDRLSYTYYGFLFDSTDGRFSTRPDLKFDTTYPVSDDSGEGRTENEDQNWIPEEDSRFDAPNRDEQGFMGFVGDFDGDGTRDLLRTTPFGEIDVHRAKVSGSGDRSIRISERPLLEHEVEQVRRRWVGDLDGDGRSDLGFTLPDRVILLVSP
jgi:hypothetical protein